MQPAKSSLIHPVALCTLSVIALWLRLQCSLGELWLDEVWTWDITGKLTWIGGILTQLKEENNHYLNTLVVWLQRSQTRDAGFYYRLPAVCCGVATVVMAWRIGGRFRHVGERTRSISAALVATSYLMVHYSSEARGYAYAVFFAALAFDQLWIMECSRLTAGSIDQQSPSPLWARWLFPIACCGGFLSQPIFLTVFGAMCVWVWLRLKRTAANNSLLPTLIGYFSIPSLFFVALFSIDLRHAVNGGGDVYPLWRVIVETLSLTGGGPFQGWGAVIVAGLVMGVFVHGLRVMARDGDDRWVFHGLVVVIIPLALLIILRRAEVYPRYFLIAVFFLLQAGAVGMADLLQQDRGAATLTILCLAGLMWGNGQHIGELARQGRNGYIPVLELLTEAEQGQDIVLRSDHDFRHPLMFKYFTHLAHLRGKTLKHVNHPDVPAEGTPWLLTHSLDIDWSPDRIRTVQGATYELRMFRPYPGLSGWGLALYQRQTELPDTSGTGSKQSRKEIQTAATE